jgi:hypothetical protein
VFAQILSLRGADVVIKQLSLRASNSECVRATAAEREREMSKQSGQSVSASEENRSCVFCVSSKAREGVGVILFVE